MPGTETVATRVRGHVAGYSNAAVAASLYLVEHVVQYRCRLGAVTCHAGAAGSGAGNTVLDVLVNGTSVWATAGNRPTLAAASTGEFANTAPERSDLLQLKKGDVVAIQVASVPAVAGHGRVKAGVTLEDPAG